MTQSDNQHFDYDYIIIGSGFGGSVSALRLSEKGYKVLVIEKGKWLKAKDFPSTNWKLKKWLWLPLLKCFGLFKMTIFRHVTVLSGVGVGGGSLVYANTLPVPKKTFFEADSWKHLANWEEELAPHYKTALTMLGATPSPRKEHGDEALQQLANDIGKGDSLEAPNVAVFFGAPGKEVADPYFDGKGPNRSGCTFCGGCMLGCRFNAKNTLDKNYLYFAQQNGTEIQAESEVVDVREYLADGIHGYSVDWKNSTRYFGPSGTLHAKGVIFAGGVMGTIKLLLKLKETSLPRISDQLGHGIRTNSEALISVTTASKEHDYSEGIAIGSLLHTDDHSHLEAVRYSAGSGFWRLAMVPMVKGGNIITRAAKLAWQWIRHPIENFKIAAIDDWAKRTQVLLFMQSLDSTLKFTRGLFGMKSRVDVGEAPTAFIPEAQTLGDKYAKIIDGKPTVLLSETLLGIPTTAHILGGACMGKDASEGVIDTQHNVFGYQNLHVCDGSSISANIGVNPSLTITALTERAMSHIPENISEKDRPPKEHT